MAIHQPEFFPWLGFFDKMKRADCYVVLDHVQFKKRYFENRNRIVNGDASQWITTPVRSKGHFKQSLCDVRIDRQQHWQQKLCARIYHSYRQATYFDRYFSSLEKVIQDKDYEFIVDFNMVIIQWFRKIFDIKTPIIFSSSLNVDQFKASRLILEVCKNMLTNAYLCGPSGKDYLDLKSFEKEGVELIWHDFVHPIYPQINSKFISHLSTLDFVFNCSGDNWDKYFHPC